MTMHEVTYGGRRYVITRNADGSFNWPDGLPREHSISRTVAANVLEYGTGALNVDGCRVMTTDPLGGGASTKGSVSHADGWDRPWKNDPAAVAAHATRVAANVEHAEALGRWPTNVVFTHDARCEPAGMRRVRNRSGSISPDAPSSPVDAVYGERERVGWQAHGDADGLETVEAWACVPSCPVAELDRQSGVLTSGAYKGGDDRKDKANWRYTQSPHEASSGGASRFYPTFRHEYEQVCALYGMLSVCEHASGAAARSPLSGQRQGSAVSAASASPSRPGAARPDQLTLSAPTAESPSGASPATIPSTAHVTALTKSSDWSAPHARSAGSLCGSCATAIAQSLAATQRGQSPMPTLGLPSTDAFSERILTQNLALYAEALASSGTTSTTTALTTSLGCVVAAISACTTRENGSGTRRSGPPPFKYQAKAPASERPRLEDGTAQTMLRLRPDLTSEQLAYVIAELKKAGVDVA